jgi:fructosamine-3-kinase
LKQDPALEALACAIADATGTGFEIASAAPVSGGCIHRALRVTGEDADGKREYFAKLNEADRAAMFGAEAEGLAALREAGAVDVPGVVAQGADEERAWLVLQWFDLAPLDAKGAALLGAGLAAQHRMPHERFGWARDNFIGASPQVNGWSDDWVAFWRSKRLHPQLRLAAHRRLPSRMIDRGERLMADCDVFFRTYAPARSLLHGDLWGGNAAQSAAGVPLVFDPAVYVGDREADVAMTQLFGGFPDDFLSAYRASWPLDDGYRVRRDFYNLYHRLNHANLFAGAHVRDSEHAIERLLSEIA